MATPKRVFSKKPAYVFVFLIIWAALHTLAYAFTTPLWQTPDEPAHVEYACLLSQRGLDLRLGDYDATLQQRIIQSLAAHDFWRWVKEKPTQPPPTTFAADPFLRNAGRQVGDEAPIFYLVPASICRLPLTLSAQVRLMRLVSGLFFVLTVAATWWAARGIWPKNWTPVAAMTAFVAGLPMLAFLGGGVNNDTAAAFCGMLAFGGLVRVSQRVGKFALFSTVALFLVALLAAWTKKTAFFWLPVAVLATFWFVVRHTTQRERLAAGAILLLFGATFLWPSGQPETWTTRNQPWQGALTNQTARTGNFSLRVVDDDVNNFGRATQSALPSALPELRGQQIYFRAWVRAPEKTQRVRLTVRDDAGISRGVADVGVDWQRVEITRTISPTTTEVLVGIAPGAGDSAAETGVIFVDDAELATGADAKNFLRNGGMETGQTWGERLVNQLAQPMRSAWAASESAAPMRWERAVLYVALLFPGFWGNFGWLQVPMPVAVYAFLAVVCGFSALGLLLKFTKSRPKPENQPLTRVAWWSFVVIIFSVSVVTAPMWTRDWQPQGRYFYPALGPIAFFFVAGLQHWSRRWKLKHAGVIFTVSLLALDAYAFFGVFVPHYHINLFFAR